MFLTWLLLILNSPAHAMNTPALPAVIEGLNLVNSSQVRVSTRSDAPYTVIVFLSARCPCSQSHEEGLARLARDFGKTARFVGIHSNADETTEESASHFRGAALPFPVVQDNGARLADQFGALKTPHAYVLAQNGDIVFQGGVDDSHDAARAKQYYLKNALAALQAGHTPEITRARSLGCQIRRTP